MRIEALKLQLRGQLAAIDEEIERQHQSDERSRAATPENAISPYIIAWSGLDAVRMHELRTAVETLGDNSSRLSASINEATHLVVDLEDRSMMAARRTLKYFEAVLRGLWIVSDEWVLASVAEVGFAKYRLSIHPHYCH